MANATEDRIQDIIPEGGLDRSARLALVNALFMKASWLTTFDEGETQEEAFTRRDGTTVTVPMMKGTSDSSARGDGWIGATKSYIGGLSAQFILSDDGRFDAISNDLERVLVEYDEKRTPGGELGLPRFETRSDTQLVPVLRAPGVTAVFEENHLLGIADDPRLVLRNALHQSFVAISEEGTEAAAATALIAGATSGPATPPVSLVLNRPFVLRIHVTEAHATLFLGHILDPQPLTRTERHRPAVGITRSAAGERSGRVLRSAPPQADRPVSVRYSAVVGSMMVLTALTLLAGKPPQRACSSTMSSSLAV